MISTFHNNNHGFAAKINVAICKTACLITFGITSPIILRMILGPLPLMFIIGYYYTIRTCLIMAILQLTFHVNIRTVFLVNYDWMSGINNLTHR